MRDVSYSFNETLRVPFGAYYNLDFVEGHQLQLTLLSTAHRSFRIRLPDELLCGPRHSFARSCRTQDVHRPKYETHIRRETSLG